MVAFKVTMVTLSDYEEAAESYLGFCPDCREFTRDRTEPDADHYDCPDCKNTNVVGAENALIMGLIEFKEEE